MNILVIDAWLPTPDRDGASLRMSNLLGILASVAERVTLAADDFASRSSGYDALRRTGIHVLVPPEVDSLPDYIAHHGTQYDVVILSRAPQAVRYFALVREHAPGARIIFDTTDLHYLRQYRGAKALGNIKLLRQALETRQQELAVVEFADATLVVSTAEQEILAQELPAARVYVVSNIHDVHRTVRPFGPRRGIVFVGAFSHHPNADAMRYFFDEIHWHLESRLPQIPITIIGSQPPDWLVNFSRETVQILGHVQDMEPYLEQCRLTIAPLRYGAGVKGKVLQSMSYGVPVVLTSIAAEGIPIRDRLDARIADEPSPFADAVAELYCNQDMWSTLSQNSLELVQEHFSETVARQSLLRVFRDLHLVPVQDESSD